MGVNERAWTFGVGLRLGGFSADYAILVGEPETSHRMTVGYGFGGFGLRLSPSVSTFSPAGEVKSVTYLVSAKTRSAILSWELSVRSGKGRLVKTFVGEGPPPDNVTWDGRDDHGGLVTDGAYASELTARLASGDSVVSPAALVRVSSLSAGSSVELRIQ
jgi:hypothetical protein